MLREVSERASERVCVCLCFLLPLTLCYAGAAARARAALLARPLVCAASAPGAARDLLVPVQGRGDD
eukprot:3384636-Rhodomonas_salina.1